MKKCSLHRVIDKRIIRSSSENCCRLFDPALFDPDDDTGDFRQLPTYTVLLGLEIFDLAERTLSNLLLYPIEFL